MIRESDDMSDSFKYRNGRESFDADGNKTKNKPPVWNVKTQDNGKVLRFSLDTPKED